MYKRQIQEKVKDILEQLGLPDIATRFPNQLSGGQQQDVYKRQRLHRIGYDDMVSIELFRPEYWELPADELGARSFESVSRVLRGIYR